MYTTIPSCDAGNQLEISHNLTKTDVDFIRKVSSLGIMKVAKAANTSIGAAMHMIAEKEENRNSKLRTTIYHIKR